MVIADTGFLYALANKADSFHQRSLELLSELNEGLITTWPVVTEVSHMLIERMGSLAHIKFVYNVVEGAISIFDLTQASIDRLPILVKKYADLPMDLADASLVLLAEELGHGRIFSTDLRDFKTYRWKNHNPFQNLLIST